MPTLTIDARCAHSGMGRYLHILLDAVRGQGQFSVRLLVSPADHGHPAFAGFDRRVVAANMYSPSEQWKVARASAGTDLLHVPNYNLPLLHRAPMLATVHDLTHLVFPTYASTLASRVYTRNMLRLVARRARHIVTISRYSADQIQLHLGVPADRISVIYLEVSPAFRPLETGRARQIVQAEFGLQNEYFLYVGGLRPHKNTSGLLRGFTRFQAQTEWRGELVLAGCDPKHSEDLRRDIHVLGLSQRIRLLTNPSDHLLAALYGAAAGFVTASLSEGFCLPVVEAMRCGAPVACSHAACLPEISGGAALLFDARDDEAIAAAFCQLLDSHARPARVARGHERAAWFARQNAASQHLDLYRSLLSAESAPASPRPGARA